MTYTITVPEDLVGEAAAAKPYSELEQQHYGEIRRLADELGRLKAKSDEAKEASRAAKKRLNEAMIALREFISSGPDMQMKLSFVWGTYAQHLKRRLFQIQTSRTWSLNNGKLSGTTVLRWRLFVP